MYIYIYIYIYIDPNEEHCSLAALFLLPPPGTKRCVDTPTAQAPVTMIIHITIGHDLVAISMGPGGWVLKRRC